MIFSSQLVFSSCLCLFLSPLTLPPPGNFKEGTHALLSSRLLVFARSSFRNFFYQMPFLFSQTHPPPPPSPNLISLFLSLSCMKRKKVVVDVTSWTAASAAPLTSRTRWDDEMVCSTAAAAFMISSLLKAILASKRAVMAG